MRSCLHHRNGFTLIEVLVVVAIIALLAAVLLPSLKTAREQGRAITCGSQLSEIFSATFMYVEDNNQILPYFGWVDGRPANPNPREPWGWPWWPTQVAKYLKNQFEFYTCPSDKEPFQIYVLFEQNRIHMAKIDRQSGSVQLDITYRSACDTLEHGRLPKLFGTTDLNLPRKITAWKRPSYAILQVEASPQPVSDGSLMECFRFKDHLQQLLEENRVTKEKRLKPKIFDQYPHLKNWQRHNGTSNVLFLDSHVERCDLKRVAVLACRQENFLDN